MVKIFISYRYTGEDPKRLNLILNKLEKTLAQNGHEVYHSIQSEKYFAENHFTNEQIYDYCIKKQEESDIFLAFVKSPEQSHEMEIESEKADELKQKYILAIKKNLDFSDFRNQAEDIIEYNNLKELCEILSNHNF